MIVWSCSRNFPLIGYLRDRSVNDIESGVDEFLLKFAIIIYDGNRNYLSK